MTRLAVRRILAAFDAAVASLRSYAAEPVPTEPAPTVAPWIQARLAHAEAHAARQAELGVALMARLAANEAELARLEVERIAAEQAAAQRDWNRRRAAGDLPC